MVEVASHVAPGDTSAAAPSETSEQSVTFRGGATIGFRSETVRQDSNSNGLCICASGLLSALRWFLTAKRAIASVGSP